MKLINIIVVLSLITLMAGCSIFNEPLQPQNNTDGIAQIRVSIATNARTLLPDFNWNFSKYVLSAAPAGDNTLSAPPEVEIIGNDGGAIGVPHGKWIITVTAYVNVDGTNYAAAKGSSPLLDVVDDIWLEISVLVPQTDGQGTFTYTATYIADGSAQVKLEPWPIGTGSVLINNVSVNSDVLGTQTNVPSGMYFLTVTARGKATATADERTVIRNEMVHIYPGQTTNANFVFTKLDFGAVAEEVTLTNGFYVVYRFDLPQGRTWQNYSSLTVDYKIDDAAMLTRAGSARAMRLMGPYATDDFIFGGLLDGSGRRMALASYNDGKNTPFIIDQLSSNQNGTIQAVAEAQGVSVTAGQWFTLPYRIDGSRAHDDFVNSNIPSSTATGPFYFGVGWTGRSDDGNGNFTDDGITVVQHIMDVTLVGKSGIPNLIATPAIFEDQEGNKYPAFTGYADWTGDNGVKKATRKTISGKFDTIEVTLDEIPQPVVDVVEEVHLSGGMYAIYRFDLPPSRTWGNYSGLSVDYKIDNAAMLTTAGSSRAMRLMGPYVGDNTFTFIGLTNGSGKRQAHQNYNDGKNAPFIIDQLSGNQGDTIQAVASEQGVDVTAGQWFTLPYIIDGSRAYSGFVSSNIPSSTATGPFYFGVGWTGNSGYGITVIQQIKNVTLLGRSGVDNLIATPVIFEDQEGNLYPAYTGYAQTNGGDGAKDAERRTISGTFDTIRVTLGTIPQAPVFETCDCGGTENICTCSDCHCPICVHKSVPTGPYTVTQTNPTTAIVDTSGSTITYDGKIWSAMGSGTWNQANEFSTSYDTRVSYQFPDAVLNYLYETVTISYEVSPYTAGVGNVAGDFVVYVNDGYLSWEGIIGTTEEIYPTIGDGTKVEQGILTYPLSKFTGDGFTLQAGTQTHANGWLLRIIKIEFTAASYGP